MRIDELCQDKYIYLDWNVVKNMINPRNDKKELDEEMKTIIYSLRKNINSHIAMVILRTEQTIMMRNTEKK